MFDFSIKKFESILVFSIFIVACLVVFAIVPNSFSISLIGLAFSLTWFFYSLRKDSPLLMRLSINEKNFLIGVNIWACLITIAVCIWAYARFVTPGYDLYWFSQAVSNASVGNGLHTSSERIYPTLLVQHWEPILYTAAPLALFFSGSVAAVLWQALGFWGGAIGAWKLCQHVFAESAYTNLKYFLTLLYLLSWVIINPLSFDLHPPAFGAMLFIPWIVYFILKNNRIISSLLLILLLQCGEMFFSIVPVYFIYLILEKKITLPKLILSFFLYCSGFLLIGFYQRYLGPWWTGLPFNYAGRYSSIGGDGIGILRTFFTHPGLVFSQLFISEKIKTFAKIFVYFGFFPVVAFTSKKYRLLVSCIGLGIIPYFIQVGLTQDANMFSTNTHYIATLGSQWWCLSVFGVYTLSHELIQYSFIKRIFTHNLFIPLFICIYFVNSSEWRKSPLYAYRGLIEREAADNQIRKYLSELPKDRGVLFAGTEWLCPLAADARKYVLCESGAENFLPVMNLDVIIATKEGLKNLYNKLPDAVKETENGKIIQNIISENSKKILWVKTFDKIQKKDQNGSIHYFLWEKMR